MMMKKTSKMAPAKKMMSGGSTKKKMKYQNGSTVMATPDKSKSMPNVPNRKTGRPKVGTGTVNVYGG